MKRDLSLSLYKTQNTPNATIDYYLSGCQQDFFNKLTLAVKDK